MPNEKRLKRAAQKIANILIENIGALLALSFASAERGWKKRESLGWHLWRRVEVILKEVK